MSNKRIFSRLSIALVVMIVLAHGPLACADEPRPTLASLVEQLGDERYQVRESATKQLESRGSEALSVLEDAVRSENPERSYRALGILLRLYQSNHPEAKTSTRTVLERLAKSDAIFARGAEKALQAPVETSPPIAPFGVAPLPLFGGVAKARQLSIGQHEGRTEIALSEGDDKVQITLNKKTGEFTGVMTDLKDGVPVEVKIAAKNADDLREKFPRAFAAYSEAIDFLKKADLPAAPFGFKEDEVVKLMDKQAAGLPVEVRERVLEAVRKRQAELERVEKELEARREK